MRNIAIYMSAIALCFSFMQCGDYLDTESPENADDEFVTSSTSETFKVLSWCYAQYRQQGIEGAYLWNDPIGSDSEIYPEHGSLNNANARLQPEQLSIGAGTNEFNGIHKIIARLSNLIEIIGQKSEFQEACDAGTINDWTQLYGEAMTFKAFCYFNLAKHWGDVPYGYENTTAEDYELSSRYLLYDKTIELASKGAEYMYKLGEEDITAERMSRGFAEALAGMAALYSGGWQTIRTDVDGLYGDIQFTTKGKEEYNSIYARRTDWLDYYKKAETYIDKAVAERGSAMLVTVDGRSCANNPFQRHFQYAHDLQISPESVFEIGTRQGGQSGQNTSSNYGYSYGRPSGGGGSNAAPCKSFAAIRIVPSFYYDGYEEGDLRRDVSMTVTGSKGDGNEVLLSFVPGNKTSGGISVNKWDENRMNPPYTAAQRQSGINWPVMRYADILLMQAEVKAELGKESEALSIVNEIRRRAFDNNNHQITASGEELKEAIREERKRKFVGEGQRRWDLIRSGLMVERAVAVRAEMQKMVDDLKSLGYHRFANGNVISNYVWVKMIHLDSPLTYDADSSNPALYPGWRGQYDYSTTSVAGKVSGTDHNLAIKGLFEYIDPESAEAKALEADGYEKTVWAINIVNDEDHYCNSNLLPGVASGDVPPRYYWPLPFEVLSKSKGKITNGYGLKQE